jgi:hypothetical protein
LSRDSHFMSDPITHAQPISFANHSQSKYKVILQCVRMHALTLLLPFSDGTLDRRCLFSIRSGLLAEFVLYCIAHCQPVSSARLLVAEQLTRSAGDFDHPTCIVFTSPSI